MTIKIAIAVVMVILAWFLSSSLKKREFPNDATGDSLQSLKNSGSDFSKPHSIDFYIVVSTEQDALAVKNDKDLSSFNVEINQFRELWSCRCNISLLPEYSKICEIEKNLENIAKKHNGQTDGWGAFEVK